MKISYNWLKQYISTELTVSEISELLTDIGLEVESVEEYEPIKGGLKGIVVGKVLNCVKHPDADRLHVTKVNVGETEPLQIICGAPNVAEGQTVLVATIGTKLYSKDGSDFEIKRSKIRGLPSEGMICAEDELGLGTSHVGIMVLSSDIPAGTAGSDLFYTKNDYVYEIGLTPNRSDAMSHFGVARDLAAAIQCRHQTLIKANLPNIDIFKPLLGKNPISVELKDKESCPRYSGLFIDNLRISESPDWLKNSLKAMGLNPINNIVDITNYVMLETGQPLHAFDSKKLVNQEIKVRKANPSKFVTLDGVERQLSGSELMICDAEKELCMAGVFGGIDSGVSSMTTSIFLESAFFNPISIRKSSKLHGLKTDSSFRFERGTDPEMTLYALKRAALLVSEICPEAKYSEISDTYLNPLNKHLITLNIETLWSLIGKKIPTNVIKEILESLDFEILNNLESSFEINAPLYRTDVTREADVIEEILRIYGFNSIEIPEKLNYTLVPKSEGMNQKEKYKEKISNWLSSNGFYESINNSLTKSDYFDKIDFLKKSDAVQILNPLSKELEFMRQSLLPGLMENILLNQNYQNSNIRLFEFGKHYNYFSLFKENDVTRKYKEKEFLSIIVCGSENSENWKNPIQKSDFYTIKSIAEQLLKLSKTEEKLSLKSFTDKQFKEGIAYFDYSNQTVLKCGIIHPKLLKYFDVKQDVFFLEIDWKLFYDLSSKQSVKYRELVNFQPVRRDLALLIDKNISFDEIKKAAVQCVGRLLKEINIFDVYEGDKIPKDKKSYALSFIFQDKEKTMTDIEINIVMNKLIKVFKTSINAELR